VILAEAGFFANVVAGDFGAGAEDEVVYGVMYTFGGGSSS
jgi:hypothetical protein